MNSYLPKTTLATSVPTHAHEQSQIGQYLAVLLSCSLADPICRQLGTLDDAVWHQLVDFATAHMVASLLWTRIQQHGLARQIPASVQERLQQAQHQVALCNLRYYHQLQQLLVLTEEQAIPLILLKGAHLAAAVYPTMDQRAMTDIDLLVKQTDLPRVVDILLDLGYAPAVPLHDYTIHFSGGAHHLPRFVKPHFPSIELHWKLTHVDDPYPLPVDELWTRAETIQLQDRSALGLSREDLLLHVCLHATQRHLLRQGLRFVCDIDAIVHSDGASHWGHGRATSVDWAVVLQRTQRIGAERCLYSALRLTYELLGTPIPEQVLQTLKGNEPEGATWQLLLATLFDEGRDNLPKASPNFLRMYSHPHRFAQLRYLWARALYSTPTVGLEICHCS